MSCSKFLSSQTNTGCHVQGSYHLHSLSCLFYNAMSHFTWFKAITFDQLEVSFPILDHSILSNGNELPDSRPFHLILILDSGTSKYCGDKWCDKYFKVNFNKVLQNINWSIRFATVPCDQHPLMYMWDVLKINYVPNSHNLNLNWSNRNNCSVPTLGGNRCHSSEPKWVKLNVLLRIAPKPLIITNNISSNLNQYLDLKQFIINIT